MSKKTFAYFDLSMKLLLILFYALFIVMLFILNSQTSNGFELSIYTSHYFAWIIIILQMSIGVYLLGYTTLVEKILSREYQYMWLFLLFLNAWVIMTMPELLGYAFYGRGDEPTHVGIVIDILKDGKIGAIIYPIYHVLIATISIFTNIKEQLIVVYIGPLLSIIGLIYIFTLGRYIFKDENKSIYVVTISFLAFLNVQSSPNRLAEFTVLIFIFTYLKRRLENTFQYAVLCTIFIIVFPFMHPLTSVILVLSIFAAELLFLIFNMKMDKSIFNLIIISSTVFCLWIWNHFSFWNRQIGTLLRWFLTTSTTPEINNAMTVFSLFEQYNLNFIEILAKYYGSRIVYVAISVLAIFWIMHQLKFSKKETNNYLSSLIKLFGVSGWILLPLLLAFALFFMPSLAGPQRMLRYIALIAPVFITALTFNLNKKKLKILMLGIIVILTINSILSIHSSPYIHVPPDQVTQMEINGMAWLFDYRDPMIDIKGIFVNTHRFAHIILGRNSSINQDLTYRQQLLDHFGYDQYSKIGDAYNSSFYVSLGKYDEIVHLNMYQQANKFNQSDFNMIYNYDYSVQKIYTNHDLNIFYYGSEIK